MLIAIVLAAAAAAGAPAAPAVPKAPIAKAAPQTVDLGVFTEFPCFENRTNFIIGGYVRTGGGRVAITRVAPNSGGCLAALRPDPAKPGMTVGTALLDRAEATEQDLLGREVKCVMSPKTMKDVGFRVVVMEADDGLTCESVKLDTKR